MPYHNNSGSFKKGQHCSSLTEFKKGFIPWNKGTTKPRNCKYCGIIFYSSVKTRKFCSPLCYYKCPKPDEVISKFRGKHYSPQTEFKKGCVSLSKGKKFPQNSGAKNSNWKGGRRTTNGYMFILCPKHPLNRKGYVREHHLIAEQILGRYLKPTEIVHHINKNRIDNHPENLYLFSTAGKHNGYHKFTNPPILTSNLIVKEQNQVSNP